MILCKEIIINTFIIIFIEIFTIHIKLILNLIIKIKPYYFSIKKLPVFTGSQHNLKNVISF